MFSFEPSYYSTSPFDSYYSQPDARRRAAILQRQREIEAARREHARREQQARIIEARRLEALRQQQEEERLRELYARQMRNRQRQSRYYEQEDDDEEEQPYYQHPFFPFFQPRRAQPTQHRQPTMTERQAPQSPAAVNIPISNHKRATETEEISSVPSSPTQGQVIGRAEAEAQRQEIERRRQAAALAIQSFWRTYSLRRRAFSQITSLRSSFHDLQSSFTFPSTVDFLANSSESAPLLDYTANNRPILAFEHAATKLLTQLDAVDSAGDSTIRAARKALVNEIESALRDLEDKKVAAWKSQFQPASSVQEEVPSQSPPAPMDEAISVQSPTDSSTTSSEAEEDQDMAASSSTTSEDSAMVLVTEQDADEEDEDEDMWVDALEEMEDAEDALSVASQLITPSASADDDAQL